MGNHLAGIAPSQIFPVEHYLTDVPELQFDVSLGSTRFLKVARARTDSGQVVVKVFTIHDPSLNLRSDRDKLLEMKRLLEGSCPNCLPFQRVSLTDRAGFVIRQFVKHSLYDRMSTRPFLTLVEKKWIAFQLLLAIQQAHKHGVCHGDIKLENVMVTSWNWVFLTDFASYKPTFLPEDNPAEFSYFFDTSRKRTCCIAPERFKTPVRAGAAPSSETAAAGSSTMSHSSSSSAVNSASQYLPDGEDIESGELVPSMDIFSAGCVLVELFTDSTPFYFSDLLAYRAGEFYPDKVLDKIEDENIKSMLGHMIQKDPTARRSANEYLSQEMGKVFPAYFYHFLQSYMQIFSTDATMMPDQKVLRIQENIDSILKMLDPAFASTSSSFDSDGLGLIVTLLTSNMRSLRFSTAKSGALQALAKIAPHVSNETILDRILPHVIVSLSDSFSSVRIAALKSLTACVKSVTQVPQSDANVFPEYILPNIIPLCHDKNQQVRAALAEHIAEIAQQSVRFLDLSQQQQQTSSNLTKDFDEGESVRLLLPTYDSELVALHDSIAQVVSVLLADNVNAVKQTLMEHSLTALAVFFGKLKANDIILSHMITFLNDKEDAQLRDSFYENIVGVAAFVGWQCSQILLPLLQQGLSDSEEFVISRCIDAMSHLTDLGLLQKHALYELLRETTPYLLHPDLWIRLATAGLISSAAKFLDPVDVTVKLSSILSPYLKQEVLQLNLSVLVLSNVESCIPRVIFDDVVRSCGCGGGVDPKVFFGILEERQTKRAVSKVNQYSDMDPNVKQLFRRLVSEGMTAHVEDKLLHMKDNLIKISRNHRVMKTRNDEEVVDLAEQNGVEMRTEHLGTIATRKTPPRSLLLEPQLAAAGPVPVNEEWQHMFGGNDANAEKGDVVNNDNKENRSPIMARSPLLPRHQQQQQQLDESGGEHASCYSECKVALDTLLKKKRGEFTLNARKRNQLGYQVSSNGQVPPAGWRPKGQLRAHMHEHDGAISKLVRLPDRPMFASAAADGSVRLWDCQKMEGSNLVNRAHKMYSHHDHSPLTTLAVCGATDLFAAAAESGLICISSFETGSVLYRRQLDTTDQGPAVELFFQETGSSPILVYGTAFGDIVGWDLRMQQGDAFKLQNGLKNGVQTALAISEDQSWAVSGTSSGLLTCWDLRFQLPIVSCTHPAESRIRQLIIQPGGSASVLAAVQGNNEVGLWSMESQCRQVVLWASNSPALSKSQPSSQSVTAMYSVRSSHSNAVITAGSDMRLRFWDLANKQQSFIVAGAGIETINHANLSYSTKLVDGVEVIQEHYYASPKDSMKEMMALSPTLSSPSLTNFSSPASASASSTTTNPKSPSMSSAKKQLSPSLGGGGAGSINQILGFENLINKPGLEPPATGHHDWISGLTICQGSSNWYVVTGSRDGVVKVWH